MATIEHLPHKVKYQSPIPAPHIHSFLFYFKTLRISLCVDVAFLVRLFEMLLLPLHALYTDAHLVID